MKYTLFLHAFDNPIAAKTFSYASNQRGKDAASTLLFSGRLFFTAFFLHDEQVVETAQEVVAFHGGLVPVAPVEFVIAAGDADDVYGRKVPAKNVKQFKADGTEGRAFLEGIGHI